MNTACSVKHITWNQVQSPDQDMDGEYTWNTQHLEYLHYFDQD